MTVSAQAIFNLTMRKKFYCNLYALNAKFYKIKKKGLKMFSLTQFPLQFSETALIPYMSEQTLQYHHGKHLATYIKNLNDLIVNTEYESMPLNEIIKKSYTDITATKIFNNAAQVFNHDFFFRCLKPNSNDKVPEIIAHAFGGKDQFITDFKNAAIGLFGSGWVWLVKDLNEIKIIATPNADTPIAHNITPIMALDVWEHAYYLDYQNRRAEFIDAFLSNLVNWDFVLENL